MFRSLLVAVLWLAAAPFVHGQAKNDNFVKGSLNLLVLECEDGQALEPVIQAVEKHGNQVRRRFESKIFKGLSVKLSGSDVEQIQGVKKIWRIQDAYFEPPKIIAGRAQGLQPEEENGDEAAQEQQWPHMMAQVDLLHKKGFTGSNITIGLVDTGVDYKHPALGGCFGKGCKVAFGDNLAPDKERGDPMDCGEGHGTMVASVVAGYDEAAGFVGVAPNATLAAYRIFDCKGEGQEDDLMAGLIRAFDDGVQIIVSSAAIQTVNWASGPAATIASRIVSNGVPCIMGVGNTRDLGLFSSSIPSAGRGVIAVASFGQADGNNSTTEAIIGSLSAYGPTWDLDVKPNIGAPGRRVRLALHGGGYTVHSGSSFAAPFVGGVAALMAQVRRTFDPVLIGGLLTAYAAPQINPFRHGGSGYYSVAQQGGGLVQAWEASRATTLVHPAALIFNDTDHRPPSIDLAVTNTAESEVTYQLSHLPALSVYALAKGAVWSEQDQETTTTAAIVTLSENSLRLGPGQSATIQVSASEPDSLDARRLPLWSGWVAINGSDGSRLTIPCQGLGASLQSATVIHASKARLDLQDDSSPFTAKNLPDKMAMLLTPPPANSGQQFPNVSLQLLTKHADDLLLGRPIAVFPLALGSPRVQMQVVPLEICPQQNAKSSSASAPADLFCVPQSMVADIDGVKSLGQVPGYPKDFVRRGELQVLWDGSLAQGGYAPPGRYKLVAKALAIFGHENNQSHWQTVESKPFAITYNWPPEAGPKPSPKSDLKR